MKTFFAVTMFALIAGCSGGGIDGKLDELTKLKDKACACTDKVCVEAVHEDYIAWKKGNNKDTKLTSDQQQQFETLRSGLMACRHKFDAPAAPAAPPATAPTP